MKEGGRKAGRGRPTNRGGSKEPTPIKHRARDDATTAAGASGASTKRCLRVLKTDTETINAIQYGKLLIEAKLGGLLPRHQGKQLPVVGTGSYSTHTTALYRKVSDHSAKIDDYRAKVTELGGLLPRHQGKQLPSPPKGSYGSATTALYRKVSDHSAKIDDYRAKVMEHNEAIGEDRPDAAEISTATRTWRGLPRPNGRE